MLLCAFWKTWLSHHLINANFHDWAKCWSVKAWFINLFLRRHLYALLTPLGVPRERPHKTTLEALFYPKYPDFSAPAAELRGSLPRPEATACSGGVTPLTHNVTSGFSVHLWSIRALRAAPAVPSPPAAISSGGAAQRPPRSRSALARVLPHTPL